MIYKLFNDKFWFQEFKCPRCGYRSIVTNIHYSCQKTPADNPSEFIYYCGTHHKFHRDKSGRMMRHRDVVMVPTEWAKRYNPYLGRLERRKVKNLPKDAILK